MTPPVRKKVRLRKSLKITYSILGAIILVVGGFAGYIYFKADQAIGRMAGPDVSPSPSPSTVPGGPNVPTTPLSDEEKSNKPITFLLAGIDSREGSGGTLNTDVLMLGSLNPKTKSASLVSLPRDLQLKPKELSSHKANYYYAYFYNKDKDTALTKTREFYSDLFDFPIDYMMMINFNGLRELADAVGGLDLNVDMDMRYVDSADKTDINLKKGMQHLNGSQVLDFVRYRKSNRGTQESSDIARNERQQQVLQGLTNKLSSFQGITQWGHVLDLLGNNVRTDIPESKLREWIMSVNKMKPDVLDVLPLESRWKSPYIIVKEDDLKAALDGLRKVAELKPVRELDLADVVGVDPSPDPDNVH
ncbi:hypothetical protein AXX17_ATUG04480 [Arabidopsis thaliana]|uniref:Cell envelope-related transcriptional attenuator domain-containing protein n=1 Tax=Arabidopsis thaliana TaxID=3702 RepID=A0A178U765_ARATH|nr:hypothetical protein AXX17_ATUG04480 [Arabidopsis thaliana]